MIALSAAEEVHRRLLEKWRKAMDLVGPGPLQPHFDDAAQAVHWIKATGLWADLGSGAGFPGVALAARSTAHVQLVESRAKRTAFLQQVVRQAGLDNAEVLGVRTESLPDGRYDGVISRAYRPPEDALADAMRLLKPGGKAVLMLARIEPPEHPGMTMFHVEQYRVDGKDRSAVGYIKNS